MKIMLCADLHLREKDPYDTQTESRLQRRITNFQIIIKKTIDAECDLLIILGDTFEDPEPCSFIRACFDAELAQLKSLGIEFRILTGNHDSTGTTYALLPEQQIFRLSVINEITLEGFDKVQFLYVPYMKDYGTLILSEEVQNPAETIIFGHFGVIGAKQSKYHINEKEGFSPNELAPFKHAFLGHYHLPQAEPDYTYVGTIARNNFGEIGFEPQCLLIEFDSNNPASPIERLPTFLRDLVFAEFHITQGNSDVTVPEPTSKTVYKYTLEGDRSWISEMSAHLYSQQTEDGKVAIKSIPTDRNIELKEHKPVDWQDAITTIAKERPEFEDTGHEILQKASEGN